MGSKADRDGDMYTVMSLLARWDEARRGRVRNRRSRVAETEARNRRELKGEKDYN
jgi:hypothetical protein